jgi:carbonic anhydrase
MLRRNMLAFSLSAAASRLFAQGPCDSCPDRSPADPWKELDDGNRRFVNGKPADRKDKCRIACTSTGQRPFAVVLTCADSRVAPELAFDQRIGDIFVVRVAGNVATDEAIGSIEYAVEHLHTPKIIVVLGHEKCGAVDAALHAESAEGLVPSILNRIYPAIKGLGPNDLDKAIRANVNLTAATLPRYSHAIHSKGIPIVGAYYSVVTGRVSKV